jgi:surface antigen
MNTTISYLLIAITLTLGLATPPAQAKALEPTPAPLWAIPTPILQTMPQAEIEPLEALKMADFKYAPMGTYSSSFAPANCTWGVASMKGNITWSGNAREWDDKARAQGKVVSDVPVVGSVGVSNDGYYGHVVLVIGVGDGTVTIREMNFDNNGGVRDYTYPTSKFVYIYI